jgi:hypothetical protein
MKVLVVAAIMLILLSVTVFCADKVSVIPRPKLEITKSSFEIKIDGNLDDPGWTNAKRVNQFVERYPGENLPPAVQTEVAITYDENYLYVGFKCSDNQNAVRATMCQRDQFGNDDAVGVFLDTYGTATTAYKFWVNPYGVQKDYLWSSVYGDDSGFDLIWKSAAIRTDSGYNVEMAIPFASLRFPSQEIQSWRIDFMRDHPRESYKQYSWTAIDRNEQCAPCQWGTIDGIRDVQPGKGMEFLPAFVAHQASALADDGDPQSPIENGEIKSEFSLGGKYAISSDITTEAAYNPDFSQIESDATQIDVNSTIALMYPERRPYFQEGSDIFRTMFNSFYTRMVNNPRFTAKLTGRMGGTSIGFLTASDKNSPYIIPLDERSMSVNAGNSYVNVLRGLHTFSDNSKLGFLVSDRRFDHDGSGTVFSLDGALRLSSMYRLTGQFITTYTTEPNDPTITARLRNTRFNRGENNTQFDGESFSGTALITEFRRVSRNLSFVLDYNQITPAYRTLTGYDPVLDHRTAFINISYDIRPENSIITRLTPQIMQYNRWNFDGPKKQESYSANCQGQLSFAQTNFGLYASQRFEVYRDVKYDGLWTFDAFISNQIVDAIAMGFDYNFGKGIAYGWQSKGKETGYTLNMTLKPIDRLTIDQDVTYAKSVDPESGEDFYSGYIARTRLQLQVNRELSGRLVLQYDDFGKVWDLDPLLTYRMNSFTVLYLGSSYSYMQYDMTPQPKLWQMTSRQYFMKIQYLIQS